MTGIEDEAHSLLPDPARWAEAEKRAAAAFPDKPAVRHGYVVGYLAASRQREGAPSIEDVAGLDALPIGSVVHFKLPRLSRPVPFERVPNGWQQAGSEATYPSDLMGARYLPARVLYAPAPDTTTKETRSDEGRLVE